MNTYDLSHFDFQLWLNQVTSRRELKACVEVVDSSTGSRASFVPGGEPQ